MINPLFGTFRKPVNQKSRRDIPQTHTPYTGETVIIMQDDNEIETRLKELDDKDLAQTFRSASEVLASRGYTISEVGGRLGKGTLYKIYKETTI